jgi:hypothetical protein
VAISGENFIEKNGFNNVMIDARKKSITLVCLLLASLVLLTSGCASVKREPTLAGKIAVFDLKTPPHFGEANGGVSEKGWWMGSRKIREIPRAGAQTAQQVYFALESYPTLERYNHTDLEKYFVNKRKSLEESFPGRTDDDYKQMMANVAIPDYGADLGVRYILSGELLEAYTSFNNFFSVWGSKVSVRLDLWDVAEGRVIWTDTLTESVWVGSQTSAMQEIAADAVKALKIKRPIDRP